MYQVLNIEQTEIYTTGDSTTHVRAYLVCDTVSDLPGVNDISGYTLEMGSRALVIQDAAKYCMQSDGTWTLQVTADVQSIITQLSDIDDRLQDTTADATWSKTRINDFITPALISVINRGPKNALDLSAAQTTTDAGVTFTVNSDFSITCTGQATATAWLHVPVTVPAGSYYVSGMPEDGGTDTYRIDFRPTPTGTPAFVADTEAPKTWNLVSAWSGYFNIRVGSGHDFGAGATLFPMMSIPDEYKLTPDYVPYSPTNRQLLDLIRSYHP